MDSFIGNSLRSVICLLFFFWTTLGLSRTVTLRWEEVEDAAFYEVQILKGGKAIHTKKVPAKKRKLRKKLSPGKYEFQVRAIDDEDTTGEWAEMKTFTVPEEEVVAAPPIVPERETASISAGTMESVVASEKPKPHYYFEVEASPSSYQYTMQGAATAFNASSKLLVTSVGAKAAVFLGALTPSIDFHDSTITLDQNRSHLLDYGAKIDYRVSLSDTFSITPRIGWGVSDVLESSVTSSTVSLSQAKLSYLASRLGLEVGIIFSPVFSMSLSADAHQPLSFTGVRGDRTFAVMDNLLNVSTELGATYFLSSGFATRLSVGYRRNRFRYKNGGADLDEIQALRYFVGFATGVYF